MKKVLILIVATFVLGACANTPPKEEEKPEEVVEVKEDIKTVLNVNGVPFDVEAIDSVEAFKDYDVIEIIDPEYTNMGAKDLNFKVIYDINGVPLTVSLTTIYHGDNENIDLEREEVLTKGIVSGFFIDVETMDEGTITLENKDLKFVTFDDLNEWYGIAPGDISDSSARLYQKEKVNLQISKLENKQEVKQIIFKKRR